MPTEKQLLNLAFDGGASDRERAGALDALCRGLKLDRDAIVARYTAPAAPTNSAALQAMRMQIRQMQQNLSYQSAMRAFAEQQYADLHKEFNARSGELERTKLECEAEKERAGKWHHQFNSAGKTVVGVVVKIGLMLLVLKFFKVY